MWTALAEPLLMPLTVAAAILLGAAAAIVAGAHLPEPVVEEVEPEVNGPLREGD
jgi:hypothetical protein